MSATDGSKVTEPTAMDAFRHYAARCVELEGHFFQIARHALTASGVGPVLASVVLNTVGQSHEVLPVLALFFVLGGVLLAGVWGALGTMSSTIDKYYALRERLEIVLFYEGALRSMQPLIGREFRALRPEAKTVGRESEEDQDRRTAPRDRLTVRFHYCLTVGLVCAVYWAIGLACLLMWFGGPR